MVKQVLVEPGYILEIHADDIKTAQLDDALKIRADGAIMMIRPIGRDDGPEEADNNNESQAGPA